MCACRIDFAVEDALPQLLEWGLVVVSEASGNRCREVHKSGNMCKKVGAVRHQATSVGKVQKSGCMCKKVAARSSIRVPFMPATSTAALSIVFVPNTTPPQLE